jgi:hypothetical protein
MKKNTEIKKRKQTLYLIDQQEALTQIERRTYLAEIKQRGIKNILKIGGN